MVYVNAESISLSLDIPVCLCCLFIDVNVYIYMFYILFSLYLPFSPSFSPLHLLQTDCCFSVPFCLHLSARLHLGISSGECPCSSCIESLLSHMFSTTKHFSQTRHTYVTPGELVMTCLFACMRLTIAIWRKHTQSADHPHQTAINPEHTLQGI